MYLTNARPDSGNYNSVIGGFIQVNRKVWKGAIRDKDTNALLWQCDHVHSRPEYNARSVIVDDGIWEYSALNCGIEAAHQWRRDQAVSGLVGLVGQPVGIDARRDDTKTVEVDERNYVGRISLREDGYRQLDITSLGFDDPITGYVILERKKDDTGHPQTISSLSKSRWLMAAVLLEGDVWGLVFRDPRFKAKVSKIDHDAIQRYIPKRKSTSTEPFIRSVRKDGKRRYEVVDAKGNVVRTVLHRGRAVKVLEEIEESA